MNIPWLIAGIVAGVWLIVALLQLGDIATVFLDSRTARDRDVPGRIGRERTNELFWVIPVGAIVALGVGVGIDYAGMTLFGPTVGVGSLGLDSGALGDSTAHREALEIGTLFLLGLTVLVVGIGVIALIATAATDPISYTSLRRQLREVEGDRITPKQLASFRSRLARIDRRTRSRKLTTPLLLRTPNMLRLATILIGIAVTAITWVAEASDPTPPTISLPFVALLAPVLSVVFAVLAIRISIDSDAAWRRVYAHQRLEILALLDGFDKSTRKRTPGLRGRVARALKILGEQQQ